MRDCHFVDETSERSFRPDQRIFRLLRLLLVFPLLLVHLLQFGLLAEDGDGRLLLHLQLAHLLADGLLLFESLHGLEPEPFLSFKFMDLGHTEQVLLVPVAGRQHHRLVEEVVDGIEQLVSFFYDVTNLLKFLQ